MILRLSNDISAVLLFLLVVSSRLWIGFTLGNANEFLLESKSTIRSLEEALRYVERRAQNTNKDLIFGVLLAKANFQWIVSTLKHQRDIIYRTKTWTDALEHLIWHCNNITAFHAFEVPILKKHLWEASAEDLKSGILKESDDDFALPEFDSCQAIDTYLMKGTPEDSDLCINEVISSSCNVSETCWLSELNGGPHSGYKTSHRLLYFQVAERMKCDKINPKKFEIIIAVKNKLCQQMLLEARALSEESHFSLTQDLFMEQIALCGLEGHEEFALEIWRNRVRNWQSREGCFGQNFIKNCSTDTFEKHNFRKQEIYCPTLRRLKSVHLKLKQSRIINAPKVILQLDVVQKLVKGAIGFTSQGWTKEYKSRNKFFLNVRGKNFDGDHLENNPYGGNLIIATANEINKAIRVITSFRNNQTSKTSHLKLLNSGPLTSFPTLDIKPPYCKLQLYT